MGGTEAALALSVTFVEPGLTFGICGGRAGRWVGPASVGAWRGHGLRNVCRRAARSVRLAPIVSCRRDLQTHRIGRVFGASGTGAQLEAAGQHGRDEKCRDEGKSRFHCGACSIRLAFCCVLAWVAAAVSIDQSHFMPDPEPGKENLSVHSR